MQRMPARLLVGLLTSSPWRTPVSTRTVTPPAPPLARGSLPPPPPPLAGLVGSRRRRSTPVAGKKPLSGFSA